MKQLSLYFFVTDFNFPYFHERILLTRFIFFQVYLPNFRLFFIIVHECNKIRNTYSDRGR